MRRAIGIVRVSEAKGREGESFASPTEQRERIEAACERDGLELVAVHEEIDVSGGAALEHREGLRAAVQGVEAGEADVLIVAYFDRLVRSLRVQGEVVERVEGAGGRVVAIDFGEVSGRTAAQWLSGTMIGAVSEYYRRSVGERSREAQAMAVARGVPPWPNIPPGYVRGEDGRLVAGEDAGLVADAFAMRARGEPVRVIREHLRGHGVRRSFHGVGAMLRSRVYLGEIHFGELVNVEAHEPIVDRGVWEAAQRVVVPQGRRAQSARLLARLGVLRCGTCGARMVVGSANHSAYPIYRCPPTGDCKRRVSVSATIAEEVVTAAVREALAGMVGRASSDEAARVAASAADSAQDDLDAAIRAFAGVADEPAARERLAELRHLRDEARDHAGHLRDRHSALSLTVEDWDRLSLDERRALIRAVVASALVMPGRGADRIRLELDVE